jgi:glycosyltransferase involved in cell wall biosynthesis
MRLIRAFLTDRIIYQSRFVEEWWETKYGASKVPCLIIHNGVDLAQFNPQGPKYQSRAEVCIISVEGNQGADLFDTATNLTKGLMEKGLDVELLMFGNSWNEAKSRYARYPFVNFKGPVPNPELPYFYRGATLYISTDIIAACPNSVIEALACGTPVLGYNAGVLPELLDESAGRCVDYRGNPWKVEPAENLEGMVNAALELIKDLDNFRRGARLLANRRYGLKEMVDAYLNVLFES